MLLVIVNASLYAFLLLIYWIYKHKFDAGFILISLYVVIAILGVLLYATTPEEWNLTLFPFLFLFTAITLFFRPFFSKKDVFQVNYNRSADHIKKLKRIANIYIVFALYFVVYTGSRVWGNLASGDWLSVRTDVYTDDLEVYSNSLEFLAYFVILYFHTAAVVLFFYFLTVDGIKKGYMFILLLAVFLPEFSWSFLTASRGILMSFFTLLIACYFIFNKGFSQQVRKWMKIGAIVFISLVLLYSLSVTMSRFGETDQSSSLLYYFGHSLLRFDYGVADTIEEYANGKYFLKRFYTVLGADDTINYDLLGTHFSTGFITFVGTLYIDFGPIGILFLALLVPAIINRVCNKKDTGIAEVYLYIFYLNYLMRGVFVIASGNSLSWLITIFIYFLFKNNIYKVRKSILWKI